MPQPLLDLSAFLESGRVANYELLMKVSTSSGRRQGRRPNGS
jgi:hypothetical protein